MKSIRSPLALGLMLCLLASLAHSKTITASGGANGDLQNAINSASDGDTVALPSGNYTWNGSISCNKAITIDGKSATITHGAGSANLMNLTVSSGGHLSVANFKFQPGNATGRYMSIGGNGQGIIIHDCYFALPNFQLTTAITKGSTGGLLYNCTFEGVGVSSSSGPGSGSGCFQTRSQKPWYDADTWGSQDRNGDQNTYVEDCTFKDMYNQACDIDDNERLVIRHCEFINSQAVTHGITSMWGGRQFEAYENNFIYEKRNGVWVNTNRYFWARAGSAVIHDNSVDKIDSGGYWGGAKPSWVFITEPLTRSGAGNGGKCETESMYPGTRWAGTGTDGKSYPSGQIVSPSAVCPVYIWNNSGAGADQWGTNDQSGYGCSGGSTKNVFKNGRDIIFSARPGYAPYTYPHPWRGGGGPTPTPSPTPTPPPTPTPTPTPTPAPSATPTPTPTPAPSPTPAPGAPTYRDWLDQLGQWIHDHPAQPDSGTRAEAPQPQAQQQLQAQPRSEELRRELDLLLDRGTEATPGRR